jgi:hypothetical protein
VSLIEKLYTFIIFFAVMIGLTIGKAENLFLKAGGDKNIGKHQKTMLGFPAWFSQLVPCSLIQSAWFIMDGELINHLAALRI